MTDAIALRADINILEGHRTRALDLLGTAFDALREALRVAQASAPSVQHGLDLDDSTLRALAGYSACKDDFLKRMRCKIDRRIWTHLMDYMGLEPLMDSKAREEFRKGLEKDPPEATAANCYETMSGLVQDSGLIFRRGLANAFSGLDRRFRSHDGFKLGSRICLRYAISTYGSWNSRAEGAIRDVERVFHVLDGKQGPLDYSAGILGLARGAERGLRHAGYTVENEYFRLRTFKNGNCHLWFLRADLVKQVNALLAEYYGETLAAGPDAPHKRKHEPNRTPAKHFGEYFSPPGVVDKVMEAANIGPGDVTLEPSAGNGAFATMARQKGAHVVCVEIQQQHANTLRALGFRGVHCGDFLDETPDTLGPVFDRIVMNPPFDRGRDVDHVSHALQFLKPGGVLVAVMSAGVEFREDAKTVDFRAAVKALGGSFHDLPAGSFSEAGTNVNTVLCVIGRGPYFTI